MSVKTLSQKRKLLIAGGGTGGHVLAGIAVAEEWKKKFTDHAEILFVGAEGGMEEKLVPRAGFRLELLKVSALKKVGFKKTLLSLFRLPVSFLKSFQILMKEKPDAVLGVGGYASGPIVLIASLLKFAIGARTAILEQNSVPGFTNKSLGRFVEKVFSAFPINSDFFSGTPVVITGNPTRPSVKHCLPSVHSPFQIFIFGGSQGAMGINTLIGEALPFLKTDPEILFLHQTGEKDFDRVRTFYENEDLLGGRAKVEKFIYEMSEAYEKASLIVCRSGSSSLSEIATVGRAAVFIPLPTAADNHQEENAKIFVNKNAAFLFTQKAGEGRRLAEFILSLKNDPARIHAVEKAVTQFTPVDSAEKIVAALIL